MPRIEEISHSGLKASPPRTHKLGAVTLFAGGNTDGKSTALDAWQLAALGEHPTAGRGGSPAKTTDDILTLAKADSIEVGFKYVDQAGAHRILRTWERNRIARGKAAGTVKVSKTVQLDLADGRRLTKEGEAEAELAKVVGPAPATNLDLLLGPKPTDSDRLVTLLDLIGSKLTWTPKRIAEQLAERKLTIKAWTGKPSLVEWLQGAYGEAREQERAAWQQQAAAKEALDALAVAKSAIDPLEVQRAQLELKRLEDALEAVSGRAGQGEQAARGALEAAELIVGTRQRLTEQLAEVDRRIGAMGEEKASPRVAQLQGQVAELEDELSDGSLPDLERALEAARARLERAQAKVARQGEMVSAAEKEGQRTNDLARTALGDAQRAAAAVNGQLIARTKTEREAFTTLQLEAQPDIAMEAALRKLLEQADPLADAPSCPTCGSAVSESTLAQAKAKADEAQVRVEAARLFLEEKTAAVRSELQLEVVKLQEAAQKAKAIDADAMGKVTAAVGAMAPMIEERNAAQASERTLSTDLQAARIRLEQLRGELKAAQVSGADQETAAALERRSALQEELGRAVVPDLGSLRQALATAEGQGRRARQQAQDELQEAKATLQPLESRLTLEREAARLRSVAATADAAWREAQRIERELGPSGLMGVVVKELLGPLEDLVNRGLAGLGYGAFAIRTLDERGKVVFRPGLQRGESFAPVETLSDSERTVVRFFLKPAIARLIGAPFALGDADAIERIDALRRTPFLKRVVEMVGNGDIDQAILAGCPDVLPEIEGITLIRLGEVV